MADPGHDARARRDSAAELREKKRVLAALVVHDLRSPLSALSGYLSLLREELEGEERPVAIAYIDDAQTLVEKALGLVATILDVDELEDGILRADRQATKLRELIDRARAGMRAHFEVRNLVFDLVCDPSTMLLIDRDLMGRVLENLLDNAARYAPRGGRVAVHVKREAGMFEIGVGNNGPPVPVAERERIFGRYFQVEARRAAARANRGLGLYFCKLAVEAHGGTIHVEERAEQDLGAVFVVRIPE
jgi:signal transduction histidine kinase